MKQLLSDIAPIPYTVAELNRQLADGAADLGLFVPAELLCTALQSPGVIPKELPQVLERKREREKVFISVLGSPIRLTPHVSMSSIQRGRPAAHRLLTSYAGHPGNGGIKYAA